MKTCIWLAISLLFLNCEIFYLTKDINHNNSAEHLFLFFYYVHRNENIGQNTISKKKYKHPMSWSLLKKK